MSLRYFMRPMSLRYFLRPMFLLYFLRPMSLRYFPRRRHSRTSLGCNQPMPKVSGEVGGAVVMGRGCVCRKMPLSPLISSHMHPLLAEAWTGPHHPPPPPSCRVAWGECRALICGWTSQRERERIKERKRERESARARERDKEKERERDLTFLDRVDVRGTR